jgi:sulfonate transport system substrate-binding protein
MISRRLMSLLLLTALLAVPLAARAAPSERQFRIGYQKNGALLILKQQETLTRRLAAQGVAVQWVEFQSGPPLLEALNAGGIDFGATGDTPPIFAQAAGAAVVYVGFLPAPGASSAILVQKGGSIATLADLKGKKIAFTRGSSAHNFVVRVLDKVARGYGDIQPVYLQPADAAAAFHNGAIDAWAIWDPFYAVAQRYPNARVLTTAEGVAPSNSFFLAHRDVVARDPGVITAAIEEIDIASRWAGAHQDELARTMAEATGVELAVQRVAAARGNYAVGFITADVIRQQQAIADSFHRLGLIPRAIDVRAAVWTPNS